MSTIRRAVLIDDNQATNFLHNRILRRSGEVEHVEAFNSAEDALAYLSTAVDGEFPRPELIFLDINMPGMNGWEFLQAYRQLPINQRGGIVVVMLTTSLNPDDHQRALRIEEVDEYEHKPLNEDRLRELLTKYYKPAQ